jgi:hypothetical protein
MGTNHGIITIPTNIQSIGDYAFEGCVGINVVDASSLSLTSIGFNAFDGCIGMTSISLPGVSQTFPSYTDIVPNTSLTYQQYWGIPPTSQISQI